MAKFYLCSDCFTIFDGKYTMTSSGYHDYCPIAGCAGSVFEIDEEMIEPIILLNTKGYVTVFCCEGHLYDGSHGGYISFYDQLPDTKPEFWYFDDEFNSHCIRYDFGLAETPQEKRNIKQSRMNALIKWANDLEPMEE